MNTIWILSAFLFVNFGDNQLVEQREFSELTECIAYSEELVRKYKDEQKGNITVSCIPK
jgi:hypothetical protein